jgi:hypothetical protein
MPRMECKEYSSIPMLYGAVIAAGSCSRRIKCLPPPPEDNVRLDP